MGRKPAFDKEEAIQGALRVFWSHGYDKTSLEDLLEAMGLNATTSTPTPLEPTSALSTNSSSEGSTVTVTMDFAVVDGSVERGSSGRSGGTTAMPQPSSTSTPPCVDVGPQCSLTAKLCDNPRYSRLVTLHCPRTCNLCSVEGERITGWHSFGWASKKYSNT